MLRVMASLGGLDRHLVGSWEESGKEVPLAWVLALGWGEVSAPPSPEVRNPLIYVRRKQSSITC
jgi:hypothetical protein